MPPCRGVTGFGLSHESDVVLSVLVTEDLTATRSCLTGITVGLERSGLLLLGGKGRRFAADFGAVASQVKSSPAVLVCRLRFGRRFAAARALSDLVSKGRHIDIFLGRKGLDVGHDLGDHVIVIVVGRWWWCVR